MSLSKCSGIKRQLEIPLHLCWCLLETNQLDALLQWVISLAYIFQVMNFQINKMASKSETSSHASTKNATSFAGLKSFTGFSIQMAWATSERSIQAKREKDQSDFLQSGPNVWSTTYQFPSLHMACTDWTGILGYIPLAYTLQVNNVSFTIWLVSLSWNILHYSPPNKTKWRLFLFVLRKKYFS